MAKKLYKTYLIQDTATGFLKIGKSHDPSNRLSQLQTASGGILRLLYVIPEDRQRQLHQRFKHLRLRSNHQWFQNSIVVINFFQNPVDFYDDNNIKKY